MPLLLIVSTTIDPDGPNASGKDSTAAACVGTPSEIAPQTNPSFVARRYKLTNGCTADSGRIAVFVFCDRRGVGLFFLTGGEEKIWSCYTGPDDASSRGVLSFDAKWAK